MKKKSEKRAHHPSKSKSPGIARRASSSAQEEKYYLRLYVTGLTPNSTRAIVNLKAFCQDHLAGRFNLEVIDIYQQPGLAKTEQIVASPTVIKRLPLPLRRLIGDLSQKERIISGLHLHPTAT